MRLDYEILENERAFKFTKEFAYQSYENDIISSIRKTIDRSAGDDTINFIENKRASDINYLSNQISIAQNTPAPISAPVNNVGVLGRTIADFINGKRGVSATNLNPQMLGQLQRFETYKTNLNIYNQALTEWAKIVSGYVNNLTNQKSLLESKSFI